MQTHKLTTLLRYAAIAGNILFILWISFNAMDEGFKGAFPEKVSYITLMGLLATNSLLLITKFKVHQLEGQ